ncbi:Bug family tripartite tricarboxylate transporter substrate binding protein [Candidimonas nitroreducens]|uniref:MFS transporter n=1 Tax=Candidimonas nitroreducens TaxID=683354 RepID=A0A225MQX2_9BURK|nr:tripartite tricarboxylate transporter substrate binding protein [Candidimonas nitroreducens]OWT63646.1 hypothetical protein CEY11_04805 [Candidimonas nitroreducens]
MSFNENRIGRRAFLVLSAGALLCKQAFARSDFPNKPVKVVVPYLPGGNSDVLGRMLARGLSALYGQQFFVENKSGSNSIIGTNYVAKSPADGYTLLFAISALANNETLYKRLPYKRSELTAVAGVARTPLVLATGHPVESLQKFIEFLHGRSMVSYATSGVGSAAHLLSERFVQAMNLQSATHVAYKGSAAIIADLVPGRVDFTFDSVTLMGGLIKQGKLHALAVTSEERLPALPTVPTLKELGFPSLTFYVWGGVFAPAATPPAVVDSLSAAVQEVLGKPEVRAKLRELNIEPFLIKSAEFNRFIDRDIQESGDLIRRMKVVLDQ